MLCGMSTLVHPENHGSPKRLMFVRGRSNDGSEHDQSSAVLIQY